MSLRKQTSILDNPPSSHNAVITYAISRQAKRLNIQCRSDSMATVSQRRVYKFGDRVIYEWEQSLEEVNVFITPPEGVTAPQIQCEISVNHVTLGLRGVSDKFINHDLASSVVVAESYWMLDAGELNINLQKMKKGFIWPSVFVGHGELDLMQQESTKQKMMLERFQEENPGLDFSNAEFSGAAPDPRTFMGGVKYT
uniref:CS domain-containing protein n=1 Tax=Peronospora matthiolae TaxID=2874970 RepID=A0AAV1UN15_9STRA